MSQAAVDRMGLWKTCLHEAGHVISAKWLLGHSGAAVVFGDGSGLAYTGGEAVPASFKDALVKAAGREAEALADLYPPPDIPMPVPLEVAYPETAGPMKAEIPALVSDAVGIARWCIAGREAEPDLWARRHGWVHAAAEDFTAEHRREIVEIATGLFARGFIRLPAQPEKGDAHVG